MFKAIFLVSIAYAFSLSAIAAPPSGAKQNLSMPVLSSQSLQSGKKLAEGKKCKGEAARCTETKECCAKYACNDGACEFIGD